MSSSEKQHFTHVNGVFVLMKEIAWLANQPATTAASERLGEMAQWVRALAA